jgi:hypothetical protein
MSSFWRLILLPAAVLAIVLAGCLPKADTGSRTEPEPAAATRARIQAAFGKLPLYFVENRGQLDDRVAYYVPGRDASVYFSPQGVTCALTGGGGGDSRLSAPDTFSQQTSPRSGAVGAATDDRAARQRWAVALDFVDANVGVRPVGQDPTAAVFSYFKGPQAEWKTGLPTYAGLV